MWLLSYIISHVKQTNEDIIKLSNDCYGHLVIGAIVYQNNSTTANSQFSDAALSDRCYVKTGGVLRLTPNVPTTVSNCPAARRRES